MHSGNTVLVERRKTPNPPPLMILKDSYLPHDIHLQNEMAVVPGDRSLSVRCVAASFGALAWVAVSLRYYVRLKIVKSFGRDDGLIGVALVRLLLSKHLTERGSLI